MSSLGEEGDTSPAWDWWLYEPGSWPRRKRLLSSCGVRVVIFLTMQDLSQSAGSRNIALCRLHGGLDCRSFGGLCVRKG